MGVMRFIGLMLLLLLLVSQEIMMETEARTCYKRSRKFKGTCKANSNCNAICKQEGFLGGRCTRRPRKCLCSAKCPKPSPTPPGDSPPAGDNPPSGDNPPPGGESPDSP